MRPSQQRIAEACAAGHLPFVPLLGFACSLLTVLASAAWLGALVARAWPTLFERTLSLAASAHVEEAHAELARFVAPLWRALAIIALALPVASWLAHTVARGPAFASLSSGARPRFAKLEPSRIASLLFCLGAALWVGLTLASWSTLSLETLADGARGLAYGLGALTFLAVLVDIAFARARFHDSLRMTRRQLLEEQREAYGAPELRAARARARASARAEE